MSIKNEGGGRFTVDGIHAAVILLIILAAAFGVGVIFGYTGRMI
jgi:hypothetical protein